MLSFRFDADIENITENKKLLVQNHQISFIRNVNGPSIREKESRLEI